MLPRMSARFLLSTCASSFFVVLFEWREGNTIQCFLIASRLASYFRKAAIKLIFINAIAICLIVAVFGWNKDMPAVRRPYLCHSGVWARVLGAGGMDMADNAAKQHIIHSVRQRACWSSTCAKQRAFQLAHWHVIHMG